VGISEFLRELRRVWYVLGRFPTFPPNTICDLLRANLSSWCRLQFQLLSQRDQLNYPALLHVLEAFLDTGETATSVIHGVQLDLARVNDFGQQIAVPLAIRLLETHEQKPALIRAGNVRV
jgi:hypothetical protein